MINKVLFCATVDIHFKAFHLPYLKWFKEQGWEVHVASNGNMEIPFTDKKYNLPFHRFPFSRGNIAAYKELKDILDENAYAIIHCHTPVGGVISRLAARKARKQGTKVIYTAHGFHFYKGSSLVSWALYYPIERFLSHFTDCLITISEEDYKLAIRHNFKSRKIKHVHGVGVDTDLYHPIKHFNKSVLRAENGYNEQDFLMFYAAEFNKNKNQQFLIKALALIHNEIPNAKLLLAGEGELLEDCKMLARKLGVKGKVEFLGYRNDIGTLLKMSDIALASSSREGLPVNVMEAMSCGLPIIASNNRGHRELVKNDKNGWLINSENTELMSEKMMILAKNEELKKDFGKNGRQAIKKKYSIENVLNEKIDIYSLYMEELEELKWAVH